MSIEKHSARVSVGSQTSAQRARNELKRKGINSKIVKIETRLNDGGCLFGLEINSGDITACLRILHDAGIYARAIE
jgi:hypothetical protein